MREDIQEVNQIHKESVTDDYLNGNEITGKVANSKKAINPMIVAENLVNVQVEYVGVTQPTHNNVTQDQKKIPREEACEISKTQIRHHTENTPTWKRLVRQADSPMRVIITIPNYSGSKRGQLEGDRDDEEEERKKKGRMETKAMNNFVKQWRLRCSLTENNENPKLELLGAWEPTCNRCPLSPCERKSS